MRFLGLTQQLVVLVSVLTLQVNSAPTQQEASPANNAVVNKRGFPSDSSKLPYDPEAQLSNAQIDQKVQSQAQSGFLGRLRGTFGTQPKTEPEDYGERGLRNLEAGRLSGDSRPNSPTDPKNLVPDDARGASGVGGALTQAKRADGSDLQDSGIKKRETGTDPTSIEARNPSPLDSSAPAVGNQRNNGHLEPIFP